VPEELAAEAGAFLVYANSASELRKASLNSSLSMIPFSLRSIDERILMMLSDDSNGKAVLIAFFNSNNDRYPLFS